MPQFLLNTVKTATRIAITVGTIAFAAGVATSPYVKDAGSWIAGKCSRKADK